MTTMIDIRTEMERILDIGIKEYVISELRKNDSVSEQEHDSNIEDLEYLESAAIHASDMITDFYEVKEKIDEWSEKMKSDGVFDKDLINEYIDWGYIIGLLEGLL